MMFLDAHKDSDDEEFSLRYEEIKKGMPEIELKGKAGEKLNQIADKIMKEQRLENNPFLRYGGAI